MSQSWDQPLKFFVRLCRCGSVAKRLKSGFTTDSHGQNQDKTENIGIWTPGKSYVDDDLFRGRPSL